MFFDPWEEGISWCPYFDAVFISEEDIAGHEDLLRRYVAHCSLLFLTAGARGATLFWHGRPSAVAPFPAREVDATGAGDVFAAAFLLRRAEGAPLTEVARFAAAAGALSVQAGGLDAVPRRAAVEALLREAGDVGTVP